MADLQSRTIAVIARELGEQHWLRAEAIHGEITPDTDLSAIFENDALDRICIACALDEAFDIELADAPVEAWTTIADVVASVAGLVGEVA